MLKTYNETVYFMQSFLSLFPSMGQSLSNLSNKPVEIQCDKNEYEI